MRSRFWVLSHAKAVEPLPMLDAVADAMIAGGVGYDAAVEAFTRAYVLRAGVASGGNASRAARLMGVHRNTVGRLLEQLGLRTARKPVQPHRAALPGVRHEADRATRSGGLPRVAA